LPDNRKPKFFYGYVVVAASFGIQAIAYGIFNSFGIFFNPLLKEFGWLRAVISGASSVGMLVLGLSSIIMGKLSDKFGPMKIMAVSGLLCGLGYLLMSQVNAVWQFYLFYSVVCIGISSTDVVLLSTIAKWFVKKRGTMSGITKVGTGVGMLIMPMMIGGFISTYGWRSSFAIVGIIALLFTVLATPFLRRDPRQMRQLPDDDKEAITGGLESVEQGLSLQEVIHTRQFWTLCAVYLPVCFIAQTILMHTAQHVVDFGSSVANAAGVLSTIGGLSIAGRFLMGSASDKIGSRQAMIICFLMWIAALSWLQFAKELWMLYVFAAVYGFGHGGFFTVFSPMVAELFGIRSHGVIFGVVTFSGMIGAAVGPVLAGYIFDITDSYQMAFLIMTAASIIGLALVSTLKPIDEERRGK